MISRGRRFQTKSGKICVVKDFNENMTFFEDGSKIETKFLLDKRFFIDLGMPINESVQQRPMQNNIDKIDPDAFFKQRNPLFEQFNSLPKDILNNLPPEPQPQSETKSNYGADFRPATNTSAIIMDDPELEKELIAQKYSHLNINKNDALQRQKNAFGDLLEEDNIPVIQPYRQPQQPVQQPVQVQQNLQSVNYMEENRATTTQIEPVIESKQNPYNQPYIDPLISMFKKTKRNTDFKMTIDLEKKIPRLDTIEMLEDSYETSIIEYLAQEFTAEILSNPNIIRDKIIEELKSMLEGNSKPSKPSKKEDKVEQKPKIEKKSDISEDKNEE
jgi:hypothetical protein